MSALAPGTSSRLEDFEHFVHDTHKKIKTLINRITHSGETDLSKDDLAELKRICRASSDELMVLVYKQCLKCLQKAHAQVRVSTVQLLDYLFMKSHVMRSKLLEDFDLFLELSLAITQRPNVKLRLPPPKKYASLLEELTAKCIHKWHAEFGAGYEKLRYAYRFLREHKLVDFARFQVTNHERRIRQQKLAEHQERVLSRSIENRLKEFRELKPELEQLMAQIESIVDLLVPREDNILQRDAEQADTDTPLQRQRHGIVHVNQSLEIEFSPYVEVKTNEDNRDVVGNLRELKRELINAKLVRLIAIEKTIAKRGEKLVDVLKEIIDLKARATNIVLKIGELKIIDDDQHSGGSASSDEDGGGDDDFEEVGPKEGLETYIPRSLRYEYGLEPIDPKELEQANHRITLTDEILKSSDAAVPSTSSTGGLCGPGPSSVAMACNVRLDSGKLCPRRDKIKCPFHGRIIPRDLLGVPVNEEDRVREERERAKRAKEQSSVPDWQDPELLSEIRAATGVDLTMPRRGAKSNKLTPKKNLLNTRTCDLTPKQRLQRRLRMLSR